TDPGAHGLAHRPGGGLPEQPPHGNAQRRPLGAAPVHDLSGERAHGTAADEAPPDRLCLSGAGLAPVWRRSGAPPHEARAGQSRTGLGDRDRLSRPSGPPGALAGPSAPTARVGSQTELTTILTTAPTTHHELLRHLKRLKAGKFADRRQIATFDKIVEWFSTPPHLHQIDRSVTFV